MSSLPASAVCGRVASLHLHPDAPGDPLVPVDSLEVVAQKGIASEPRYFERVSRIGGQSSRRQVSLIEREQIAGHAAALGLAAIPPGAVRSNIETTGINLISLIGHRIEIGEAILFLYQARTPCTKMDAVCDGLRSIMEDNKQGVLAEIVRSGRIRLHDPVRLAPTSVAMPVGGTPL